MIVGTPKHETILPPIHINHAGSSEHARPVTAGLSETTGADLILLASHHPDPMRGFPVGSQADRIMHRAPISVLVVRG